MERKASISHDEATVRELRENPLTYSVLAELSTHPRVTYLAQLRNPHPDLMSDLPEPEAGHVPEGGANAG